MFQFRSWPIRQLYWLRLIFLSHFRQIMEYYLKRALPTSFHILIKFIIQKSNYSTLADKLVHVFHIQEVQGTSLGLKTRYPDRSFTEFHSPSRPMPEQLLKSGHNCFLPYPSQFMICKSSHNFTQYNVSYWKHN
jgi:hypothetical protein